MKRRLSGAIFLLAAILVFAIPSSGLAQEKVIKWGVATPLQLEGGIGAKNATIIAAEEINAAGGILGRKVECFFEDDAARPEIGINAVKKLMDQDKVDFISGGFLSGVGLGEAPHIFAAKKLWFSVGPATPKLAAMVKEDYERAKYWFRCGTLSSDNMAINWSDFFKEFWKEKMGMTKVALLGESSVWARESYKNLERELPAKGLEVVYGDVFDPKRTDFSPQFAKIRASGAQILSGIEAASPGIPLTKQWADTQLPIHRGGYNMYAQNFNYWDKTGGKCLAEVVLMANGARAPISSSTIPFFDKYVERHNEAPTYTAFGAYDALYLLKHAAEKANSLDTDTLIKTLEKIDFDGVAGKICYDANHDLVYDSSGKKGKSYLWVQWQGPRKMVVLWPFKFATGDYLYPAWLKK